MNADIIGHVGTTELLGLQWKVDNGGEEVEKVAGASSLSSLQATLKSHGTNLM